MQSIWTKGRYYYKDLDKNSSIVLILYTAQNNFCLTDNFALKRNLMRLHKEISLDIRKAFLQVYETDSEIRCT